MYFIINNKNYYYLILMNSIKNNYNCNKLYNK